LQQAWGTQNFGLYTHHFGVGIGPAVWSHSLLPDYDLWCGRGGYAFPLYDRRGGPNATNLSPVLLTALAEAYGAAQAPQAVFDAILGLLSAASYTRRFAEDLEDTFPHIPFPADPAVFAQAAAIGARIRELETFAKDVDPAFKPKAFCRLASEPTGPVGTVSYPDGEVALCDDGSCRMTGLPDAVWSFTVSGYRVLPRWIEARRGLPAADVWEEFRDIAARIHELIQRFSEADLVLSAVLADTLTREELGFPAPTTEADGQNDE
jgi:hypothetical protein